MAEQENEALNNLCRQITPRIRELVDTKIAENLKSLKQQYEENLAIMTSNIKKSLYNMEQKVLKDHNRLMEQINSVKNSVEVIHQKQSRLKEDEEGFSKVCYN